MPAAFTFLLAFQLVGLFVVTFTGVAVPEPVVGLILMFLWLRLKWPHPQALESLCTGLLQHLSLLFVPAAVGLLTYTDLLAAHWVPIVWALVISTPLSLAVAAWVFGKTAKAMGQHPKGDEVKS